jgi:membrane protease YdiL (CAAX protease family)
LSLALVLAILLAFTSYGQLLARPAPEKWFPPAAWLPRATNGLINGTLICTLASQLILIGGFLLGICRFRPHEIGLDVAKLRPAIILTVLVWAGNQILLLIILAFTGYQIAINPQWTSDEWTRAAGAWLGQLFGNTPLEEVVFRGFLLPQCLLVALSWMPRARDWIPVLVALIISQALFTALHAFFNLHDPHGQWLLLAQFVMGLLFAGVYLQTGNLFLAMGLHTLINNPGPLLKEPYPGPGLGGSIIALTTLLALAFGPLLLPHRTPPQKPEP